MTPETGWYGALAASSLQVRSADRKELSGTDRASLLADVVAGLDRRVTVEATVYLQAETPNKNFVRFKPSALRPLAKSFVGKPFLRDHAQWSLDARGGTIIASEFSGSAGEGEIRQTFELSAPWAVEAALRGLMDRFSIGWARSADAEVICSECEKPFVSAWYGVAPSCAHLPGDVIEAKDGTKHYVEAVFTGAEGVETSAVNNPAVAGTGIDSIRASLSAGRAAHLAHAPHPQKEKSMKTIALKLGLSEEASEESIGKAIDSLAARGAANGEALAARDRELVEVRSELAGFRESDRTTKLAALVEQVRAKIGPKIGPDGKPVLGGTETEKRILAIAEKDMALAASVVADLPQIIAPSKLRSIAKEAPPTAPSALSAEEKAHCKAKGISEESYLAAKLEVLGGGKKRTGTDDEEED